MPAQPARLPTACVVVLLRVNAEEPQASEAVGCSTLCALEPSGCCCCCCMCWCCPDFLEGCVPSEHDCSNTSRLRESCRPEKEPLAPARPDCDRAGAWATEDSQLALPGGSSPEVPDTLPALGLAPELGLLRMLALDKGAECSASALAANAAFAAARSEAPPVVLALPALSAVTLPSGVIWKGLQGGPRLFPELDFGRLDAALMGRCVPEGGWLAVKESEEVIEVRGVEAGEVPKGAEGASSKAAVACCRLCSCCAVALCVAGDDGQTETWQGSVCGEGSVCACASWLFCGRGSDGGRLIPQAACARAAMAAPE